MEEYKLLLKPYLASDSLSKVILCTPPWAIPASHWIAALTNDSVPSRLPEIEKAVHKLGEGMSLPVVELYPLFEGKTELLSYDGLHPSIAGARCIAKKLVEVIL